jgi:DNA modification methylase
VTVVPFIADADFTLYVGDALETLREFDDESVHCVVTSPPYWGLRDYGTGSWDGGDPGCDHSTGRGSNVPQTKHPNADGYPASAPHRGGGGDGCDRCGATRVDRQIGLEPTPDAYVAAMVAVFAEVRRVLRSDGTCWLNIGDSYNTLGQKGQNGHDKSTLTGGGPAYQRDVSRSSPVVRSLKAKDMVGIPWMLAFALRADGWWLRAEIVWAKPNPMPESVTDRPTKSHEQVFLLTRSPRYFYDADAIREEFSGTAHARGKGLNPKALARGPVPIGTTGDA